MENVVIDSLIRKLDTQSDKTAAKVIDLIMDIGKASVPSLIKAAKNKDNSRIRKWSLLALGNIGDKKGAKLLMDALEDDMMSIRLQALKGLKSMKYQKGSKEIAALLNDESGGIRVNTLYTLMELKDSSSLPQIVKCLDDQQWYVRQNACVACGLFNATKAKSKLKKLSIEDEKKAVREAAKKALSDLK